MKVLYHHQWIMRNGESKDSRGLKNSRSCCRQTSRGLLMKACSQIGKKKDRARGMR